MKRYVIVPGYIKSKSDGDIHFIDAPTLIRLYKVDPKECVIAQVQKNDELKITFELPSYDRSLIRLGPRYHGDYTIPEEQPE